MGWYEIQGLVNEDSSHLHVKSQLPKAAGSVVVYSALSQVNYNKCCLFTNSVYKHISDNMGFSLVSKATSSKVVL